jgi:hypothetical protein
MPNGGMYAPAEIELFPRSDANRALSSLKNDAIRGATVLRVS